MLATGVGESLVLSGDVPQTHTFVVGHARARRFRDGSPAGCFHILDRPKTAAGSCVGIADPVTFTETFLVHPLRPELFPVPYRTMDVPEVPARDASYVQIEVSFVEPFLIPVQVSVNEGGTMSCRRYPGRQKVRIFFLGGGEEWQSQEDR